MTVSAYQNLNSFPSLVANSYTVKSGSPELRGAGRSRARGVTDLLTRKRTFIKANPHDEDVQPARIARQIAVGRSARHILEAIDKDRADRG
jgi:hypothetical protein